MHRISPIHGLVCLAALLAAVAACDAAPEATDLVPDAPAAVGNCVDGGSLGVEFYGSLDGRVDWRGADLSCEGMPRPDEEGARLRFAGPHPSGTGTLVVIAAVPTLGAESTSGELATRLTLIEEGRGRFFATSDFDACWTEILSVDDVGASVQKLSGRISCISPLAEVNGSGGISVRDLVFTGIVDWDAS